MQATFLAVLPMLPLLGLLVPGHAQAWELTGTKSVVITTTTGERITVGSVIFEPRADGAAAFKVALDHSKFTDHFLSMREFKCLGGTAGSTPSGGELACHVPYPYRNPMTVSPGNYAWLEHSLMFMFKLPSEFGAKLWNGLYFQLKLGETGLTGTLQAIDLNRIASPPTNLDVPPYRPALRDEVPAGSRWVKSLSIE